MACSRPPGASLDFVDPRREPAQWAQRLGVSQQAVELLLESPSLDLHVDSYLWVRMGGYDLGRRHSPGPLGARWARQVDLPRLRESGLSGAVWIITTNPWRSQEGRLRALLINIERLQAQLLRFPQDFAWVTTRGEFLAARAQGKQAAFLGLQGANALASPKSADRVPFDRLVLATLVHMTSSPAAASSFAPCCHGDHGLGPQGQQWVELLESRRVLVDLAHASPATFWDVVACHDHSRPLIVSHTGFSAVHRHWRNLDDTQLKAVADSGGVVGILYHGPYLGDGFFGGRVRTVAEHIRHAVQTVGAEHVSLGSDWDGLIATPRDMPTCLELPRLVQALLDLRVTPEAVIKVLGQSFLDVLERVRPNP